MNGYDLENQSRGRGRLIFRWSTVLTATGSSEPSYSTTCFNVRVVATTNWLRIWLRALMRAAHCSSMRRWMFKGYMALIRSTSLTRPTSPTPSQHLCTNFAFASPDGSSLRLPHQTLHRATNSRAVRRRPSLVSHEDRSCIPLRFRDFDL